MKKVVVWTILLVLAVTIAHGIVYKTDRLNFPPGESRIHFQNITLDGPVNLTATIPNGFNVTNVTGGGNVSTANITWFNVSGTISYTFSSPSNCSNGDFFSSKLFLNQSFFDEFRFLCVPDDNVVDFKVEYGHGDANFLDNNELFINDDPITLFHLLRVFDLGFITVPNDNPENVSLNCVYPDFPVRTFGRNEIRVEDDQVNVSYFWREIQSGFWFRIGVLSQDSINLVINSSFNVTCNTLTYDFEHHQIQATFTNYTIQVRNDEPYSISLSNDTANPGKSLVSITNSEIYSTHKLSIHFIANNNTAQVEYPRLLPNETIMFRIDSTNITNVTVFFIPSWYKNSRNPQIFVQSRTFFTANNDPSIDAIPDATACVDQAFVFDVNATDPDNDTLTFTDNTTLFVINPSTGLINVTPTVGQVGAENIRVSVDDGFGGSDSTTFTLAVVDSANAPAILSTIPSSSLVSLVAGQSQTFTINKTDGDNDTLTTRWFQDGSLVQTTTDSVPYGLDNFTLTPSSAGNITLLVNVSDNCGNFTTFQWNISVNESAAPPPTPTGGQGGKGGGGGGGKPYIPAVEIACVESWSCTGWGGCIGDYQYRVCADNNNCSTVLLKPNEQRRCVLDAIRGIINISFPPSCYDGKQNQGEEGIDCGYPCQQCAELEMPALMCGDNICQIGEGCNCPQDCKIVPAWLILIIGIVLLLLFCRFVDKKIKNKVEKKRMKIISGVLFALLLLYFYYNILCPRRLVLLFWVVLILLIAFLSHLHRDHS